MTLMCRASAAGFSMHRGFWNLVWGPGTCVEAQFHCSCRSVWDRVIYTPNCDPRKCQDFTATTCLSGEYSEFCGVHRGTTGDTGACGVSFHLQGKWGTAVSDGPGGALHSQARISSGGVGDCLPDPDRCLHHHSHQLYCKLASQIQMFSLTSPDKPIRQEHLWKNSSTVEECGPRRRKTGITRALCSREVPNINQLLWVYLVFFLVNFAETLYTAHSSKQFNDCWI